LPTSDNPVPAVYPLEAENCVKVSDVVPTVIGLGVVITQLDEAFAVPDETKK
jgi:hypothetical protein